MKSDKQALLDFVASLTPAQVEKIKARLDTVKQVANLTDNQHIYINAFMGKMFPATVETSAEG